MGRRKSQADDHHDLKPHSPGRVVYYLPLPAIPLPGVAITHMMATCCIGLQLLFTYLATWSIIPNTVHDPHLTHQCLSHSTYILLIPLVTITCCISLWPYPVWAILRIPMRLLLFDNSSMNNLIENDWITMTTRDWTLVLIMITPLHMVVHRYHPLLLCR